MAIGSPALDVKTILVCLAGAVPALLACTTGNPDYSVKEKQYIDHVLRKIEIIGETRHPQLASYIDKACTVEIRIQISHGGRLLSAELLPSSCNPAASRALHELIEYAAPYPPMSAEIQRHSLSIHKRWKLVPASN